jgi:hypothetical protein
MVSNKRIKMKKIGIALSVYNKIDELNTNINIIRSHWKDENDSFISVCCNDPSSFERVKSLDIDKFTAGDHSIQNTPKPYRRLRIFDCIMTSILNCSSEFIVHYHSDAYATKVEPILEIIDFMNKNNIHVAFRGRGLEYRTEKCIHGDVDDHFIIFRKSEIDKRNIFNIDNIVDYFKVGNPESLLSFIIQSNFKENEIYFYDDMRYNKVNHESLPSDEFYQDNIMHRAMNPYNLDLARGFYHIGDSSLVQDILTNADIPDNIICKQAKDIKQQHVEDWLNE